MVNGLYADAHDAVAVALSAPILLAFGFTLLASIAVLVRVRAIRAADRRAEGFAGTAPVYVLRPTERIEASWLDRVAREGRARSEVTTVVISPDEPSVGASEDGRLRFVRSREAIGAACNRKVAHLAAGVAALERELARADAIIVQADADVELEPRVLSALIAAVATDVNEDVRTDLAFAIPFARRSFALEAVLMTSLQSFAVIDALAWLGRSPPAVAGKCLALRAGTLRDLGGYAAFAPFIADDVAMVERASAAGLAVRPIGPAVGIDGAACGISATAQRMARWLQVLRSQRPHLLASYPLLIAPIPLCVLFTAFGLARGACAPAVLFLGLVVARAALAAVLVGTTFRGGPVRAALFAPFSMVMADVILNLALLNALLVRDISWRGHVYRMARGGRIRSVGRGKA